MTTNKPSRRRMLLEVDRHFGERNAAFAWNPRRWRRHHQHPIPLHQPLHIHCRRRDELELDVRP